MQKVQMGFLVSNQMGITFSLIKKVNVAMSTSSIILIKHSSILDSAEPFHLCAYNNCSYYIQKYIAVIMYKNTVP